VPARQHCKCDRKTTLTQHLREPRGISPQRIRVAHVEGYLQLIQVLRRAGQGERISRQTSAHHRTVPTHRDKQLRMREGQGQGPVAAQRDTADCATRPDGANAELPRDAGEQVAQHKCGVVELRSVGATRHHHDEW
jgi:hypothetical protein